MAIQAVATKVREAFTGSKYDFDFDFEVYDETELLVYAIDTTTSPETKTLLTLGVDYSVTLNEVTPGGTVTYTDARSSDYDSFIESDVPYEQETAFPNAEAVELMGDKLCRQIQQLKDAADRTIKLDSATAVTSITVDEPIDRRALVAEVTGGVVTIVPSDYDPDELGTSAAEAAASAAAAADSEAAAAGYAASINLPSPLVTTGAFVTVKSDLTGYEFLTRAQLLALVYPVGSVVTFGVSTNPATLFGFGTWAAIAGKVIVGIDAGQEEFDTLDETGGEKTHQLVKRAS